MVCVREAQHPLGYCVGAGAARPSNWKKAEAQNPQGEVHYPCDRPGRCVGQLCIVQDSLIKT